MTDLDAYAQLAVEARGCTLCPLHEERTQVVFDRGNPSARLAIVGEAPGQREDETGLAFVGPAGKRLDDLLVRAGIASNAYVIFNVLKCRPPGNRFPGSEDSHLTSQCVRECLKWYDRQFQLVSPKVVLLVGRKALEWTLFRNQRPGPNMATAVGKWYQSTHYPGVDFLVMYHTSYILRREEEDREQARDAEERTLRVMRWAAGLLEGNPPKDEKPVLIRAPVVRTKLNMGPGLFD